MSTNAAVAVRAGSPHRHFVLLILDSDVTPADDLVAGFADYRVEAYTYTSAGEALLAAGRLQPDAVIVGAGLPDRACTDVTRVLAGRAGIPVLVGVGAHDGDSAVAALSVGATVCVARPYRVHEIVPLLRAIRPETTGPLDPPVECGGLRIDPGTLDTCLHGRKIRLPLKEFRLLHYFLTHADRIVTREEILTAVWPGTATETSNTLSVHIKRLRQRLGGPDQGAPRILTVRGLGYRFLPPAGNGTGPTGA